MKRIINMFVLAYQRLFTGETPLFFKYWGAFVNTLSFLAVTLTAKALLAPEPIRDRVQVFTWCFDVLVAILHGITPYMTTKNNAVAQDDFDKAIKAAKELKHEPK